jgi:hypothetical protein
VEECDTLLAACFVFIDFIHPVWIRYSQWWCSIDIEGYVDGPSGLLFQL